MSDNGITSIVAKPILRRDLNAQATRAEIIRMARVAFAERGYASVRLDDIARAANATTGAIYHHFGGKSGLLLAVGESVEQEVVAAIRAGAPVDASPWDAIGYAVDATLDLCSRPEVSRIIFIEAPNVLGAATWRTVEMRYGLGGFHALFRRAAESGELKSEAPDIVTRLVMAALIEAVEGIVEDPGAGRIDAIRGAMRRLLAGFRP